MENASKALIMAGGMLLAILLVSLLIYAWSLYSEYQTSRVALIEIEDTAKFNSQFEGYNRDDVQGYELLSLLNQIVDYNERRTYDTLNGGNDKYPPIEITIDLVNENTMKKLTYNSSNILLFKDNNDRIITKYTDNELTAINNNVRTSFKKNIDNKIQSYEQNWGVDETTLTAMAKNIRAIFKTDDEQKRNGNYDESIQKQMIVTYNSYMKNHILENNDTNSYKDLSDVLTITSTTQYKTGRNNHTKTTDGTDISNLYKTLCAYYEYMQFKRGIFKCTNFEYDSNNTGRVVKVYFTFTGNIK